jgi:hypothetical protein
MQIAPNCSKFIPWLNTKQYAQVQVITKKPITKFPDHMSSHRVQNAHQQCSQGALSGHVRTFTLINHWPMFNDGHTYSHISLVVEHI